MVKDIFSGGKDSTAKKMWLHFIKLKEYRLGSATEMNILENPVAEKLKTCLKDATPGHISSTRVNSGSGRDWDKLVICEDNEWKIFHDATDF